MTTVELSAWASTTTDVLSGDEAKALSISKALTVLPDWESGAWSLTAGSLVGIVRAGDVEVRIRPRIKIARLIYLLGFSQDPDLWHDDPAGLDGHEDLWPAMAELFVRQFEAALLRGVLQGYRTEESAQTVLRGRLREADQLRLHTGVALPLEVRYDEYDVDIAENRLLRAAAERLLRMPDVPPPVMRRLRRLVGKLGEVSRLNRGQPLPAIRKSRLNQRYQPALQLARMVLSARSVDVGVGSVRATGFVVDMNKLFEDFVTITLQRTLTTYGGCCRTQDPSHPLDEARQIRMKPDLVRYAPDGQPQAVIDAKYKAEAPSGFPYADLYQLLAYCTATATPVGHLVYAEGGGDRVIVRNSGVSIQRHSLDLSAPVAALQRQVADIAQLVVQPAGSSS